MNHFYFDDESCEYLIEKFGEQKLANRYDALYTEAVAYIDKNKLSKVVTINKFLLSKVIIDYFYDIDRIKHFHDKIELVNSEKVISYISYWFLRIKPIQVIDTSASDKRLETINERFILQYILDYLSERVRKSAIILRKETGLKNFAHYLLYFLEYRIRDPQSLEMILISFFAGQIYENTNEDLSSVLHSYDHT